MVSNPCGKSCSSVKRGAIKESDIRSFGIELAPMLYRPSSCTFSSRIQGTRKQGRAGPERTILPSTYMI